MWTVSPGKRLPQGSEEKSPAGLLSTNELEVHLSLPIKHNKTIDNTFYLASRRWLNNKSYQLTSLPLSEHPLSFQTPSETGERSWVRNPKYPKGRLQPLIQNDFCHMSGLQNHSIVQICTVPNQPSATNAAGRAVGDGAWRSPRKRGYLNLSLSLWLQPPKSSKILQIMISARGRFFSPNAFQAKILFQAGIIARMNS